MLQEPLGNGGLSTPLCSVKWKEDTMASVRKEYYVALTQYLGGTSSTHPYNPSFMLPMLLLHAQNRSLQHSGSL